MEHLKIKTLATPTPEPFDVNLLIKAVTGLIAFLFSWWKIIDAYYKHKKINTEEFIQKVATACVKATLDTTLSDVKSDINTLFKYREEDRKHYDERFDKVITAIKK